MLEDPVHFPGLAGIKRKVDGGDDEVMYLEGSDQHRGWFQSSLLESCGTRGRAPFDVVLTHGFTLDEKGRKMSKSLGNQTFPQDVIKSSGADILRLWAASVDYSDDQRIGPEILKSVSDNYRKLRNSLRWMLGTLAHRPLGPVGDALPKAPLERLMLHRLAELDPVVRKAYADFDYAKVVAALASFMNVDLSAFYFDIRKDALYCDAPSSETPARGARRGRAHLPLCDRLARADPRLHLRRGVGVARSVGRLGPSRAVPERPGGMARRRARQALGDDPPRPLGRHRRAGEGARGESDRLVARSAPARLRRRSRADGRARRGRFRRSVHHLRSRPRRRAKRRRPTPSAWPDVSGVAVVVERAPGVKCARSWRYFDPATADPDYPDVSPRDAAALRELGVKRRA